MAVLRLERTYGVRVGESKAQPVYLVLVERVLLVEHPNVQEPLLVVFSRDQVDTGRESLVNLLDRDGTSAGASQRKREFGVQPFGAPFRVAWPQKWQPSWAVSGSIFQVRSAVVISWAAGHKEARYGRYRGGGNGSRDAAVQGCQHGSATAAGSAPVGANRSGSVDGDGRSYVASRAIRVGKQAAAAVECARARGKYRGR